MRSNPLLSVASVGLIALVALGCGQAGGDATVEGMVTIDGFPLESGTVVFVSASSKKTSAASGSIDSLGNYSLVIGRGSDLDSGEYLAQVKSVGPAIEQPDGAPPLPGPLLTPVKYAKAETSGLRYRLRPGKNVIDIALASDPEPESEAAEEAAEEPVEEERALSEDPGEPETTGEEPAEDVAEEALVTEESPAEDSAEAEKPAEE